jgi:hypothetical protein
MTVEHRQHHRGHHINSTDQAVLRSYLRKCSVGKEDLKSEFCINSGLLYFITVL